MNDANVEASLVDRLAGLLSIHEDEHVDALSRGHYSPWLVLHLHLLRDISSIRAALDATTELFLATERVRCSHAHYTALWKRVLTSRMMIRPLHDDEDATAVHLPYRERLLAPLCVLLDLSGVAIKDEATKAALRDFFQATRPLGTQQLTVGVRIARSGLKQDGIASLDALLSDRNSTSDSLISAMLGRLDLSDNGLTPASLQAVATLLRKHTVRELCLENVLGRAALPETVAAFQSLLQSVFARPELDEDSTSPLRLSLASNSLDGRYFQAIADTLEMPMTTRRSLQSLSLARTFGHVSGNDIRDAIWQQLTRVLYYNNHSHNNNPRARSDAVDHECELDLRANTVYQHDADIVLQTRASLVEQHMVTIHNAVATDTTPVVCRVVVETPSDRSPAFADRLHGLVDWNSVFHVVGFDPQDRTRLQVAHPTAMVTPLWIQTTSISELQVDERHILLRPRFTSLLLDDLRTTASLADSSLFPLIHGRLRKLSLRRHSGGHSLLPSLLMRCPHLTHLDLDGCRMYSTTALWAMVRHGGMRQLQSLNLSGNLIGAQSVLELLELARALPVLPLRHVRLTHNHIGLVGLLHLRQLLQENTTLEIVEMDATIDQDGDGTYAAQRQMLSQRHDEELLSVTPLPMDARLAFLSVMRSDHHNKSIDTHVLSLIVQFAASRVVRHLRWRP